MDSKIESLGKVSFTIEGDYNPYVDYDKLCLVYDSTSLSTYISRCPVPKGTPLTDKKYWFSFSSLNQKLMLDYNNWIATYNQLIENLQTGKVSVTGQTIDAYVKFTLTYNGKITEIENAKITIKEGTDSLILTPNEVSINKNGVWYKLSEAAKKADLDAEIIARKAIKLYKITPTSPSVREEYVLRDKDNNDLGDHIKVYKDSSIYNVYVGHTDDTLTSPYPDGTSAYATIVPGTGSPSLSIVYSLASSAFKLVNIPISDFIVSASFGAGLKTVNGVTSLKLAEDTVTTTYLYIDNEGYLKLKGINTIASDVTTLKSDVTTLKNTGVSSATDAVKTELKSRGKTIYPKTTLDQVVDETTSKTLNTIINDKLDAIEDDYEEQEGAPSDIPNVNGSRWARYNYYSRLRGDGDIQLQEKVPNYVIVTEGNYQSQFTTKGAIYHISIPIDLYDEENEEEGELTVPDDSVLFFTGNGSIKGGTLKGKNILIEGKLYSIFGENINFESGFCRNEHPRCEWFYEEEYEDEYDTPINKCLLKFKKVSLLPKVYYLNADIDLDNEIGHYIIEGCSGEHSYDYEQKTYNKPVIVAGDSGSCFHFSNSDEDSEYDIEINNIAFINTEASCLLSINLFAKGSTWDTISVDTREYINKVRITNCDFYNEKDNSVLISAVKIKDFKIKDCNFYNAYTGLIKLDCIKSVNENILYDECKIATISCTNSDTIKCEDIEKDIIIKNCSLLGIGSYKVNQTIKNVNITKKSIPVEYEECRIDSTGKITYCTIDNPISKLLIYSIKPDTLRGYMYDTIFGNYISHPNALNTIINASDPSMIQNGSVISSIRKHGESIVCIYNKILNLNNIYVTSNSIFIDIADNAIINADNLIQNSSHKANVIILNTNVLSFKNIKENYFNKVEEDDTINISNLARDTFNHKISSDDYAYIIEHNKPLFHIRPKDNTDIFKNNTLYEYSFKIYNTTDDDIKINKIVISNSPSFSVSKEITLNTTCYWQDYNTITLITDYDYIYIKLLLDSDTLGLLISKIYVKEVNVVNSSSNINKIAASKKGTSVYNTLIQKIMYYDSTTNSWLDALGNTITSLTD